MTTRWLLILMIAFVAAIASLAADCDGSESLKREMERNREWASEEMEKDREWISKELEKSQP